MGHSATGSQDPENSSMLGWVEWHFPASALGSACWISPFDSLTVSVCPEISNKGTK